MINKDYICNLIDKHGIVKGCGFVKVKRWKGASYAYDELSSGAKKIGLFISDFRRIM